MISNEALRDLAGRTMRSQDGDKIGKVVDVYESTGDADGTFVTVSTGLLGGGAHFVPLARATSSGNDIVVPYDKDLVKDAPDVQNDEELTAQEEERLYDHYNLLTATRATGPATGADTRREPLPTQRDVGPEDGVMTRSEERLQVGVQRTETGRARLRKRIVSETVSTTVPVSTERAVVTTEPVTDANRAAAMDGQEIRETVHEVVLHGERPVVDKQTVPVERVRLATDEVTEQQTVSADVRSEQIEVDGDVPRRG